MLLRRSLSLLSLLTLLGAGSLVTAQEARPGVRTGAPSRPLETLRTEDLKRRASLLAAEGKRIEAARLVEQVAQRSPSLTSEWVRAIWLYYDAGAYPEMLRVARGYQAAFPGFANGRHELRAAEVLTGASRLDWNSYRSRIRETPPGAAAQPVELATAEGGTALAYLLWRETAQPRRALALLEKVTREHPELPEARLLLVDLYRSLGREEDAERERAAYVRLDPESPRSAVFQVWRLKALGKKEEAIRALQAVREKNPASTALLKEIADTYDALGRPDQVESTWSEALFQDLKRSPADFFAHFQPAVDYFVRLRQWDRLSGMVQRLLAERPQDPFLACTLAQAFALGEHPEKIVPLARAARPGTFEAEIRTLGVLAALATGDTKTARELLPERPRSELLPIAAWLDPERKPTADDYFTGQASRFMVPPASLAPPQPPGYHQISLPFDALRVLEDLAAERVPQAGPLQVQRALRLKELGEHDRAAAIMEQVSRERPDWWPPLLFLFYYHLVGHRPGQAQQFRARLEAVKPPHLPVFGLAQDPTRAGSGFGPSEEQLHPQHQALRAAQGLMLEGKLEEAQAALQRLLSTPVGLEAHRTLGALYLALEKPDEAQREWREVGLHPPLTRDTPERPGPPPPAGGPPQKPIPLPTLKGDGSRFSHYAPAVVATHAAELFQRRADDSRLGERLWEFLLRRALAFDKGYLPALAGLGHLLRSYPGPSSPRPSPAVQAARLEESRALLEQVIRQDPTQLHAYWALERFEEAARRNPNNAVAWRRLTNTERVSPELMIEACRQIRRLDPHDIDNRARLVLLLARDHPEYALREARSLAGESFPERALAQRSGFRHVMLSALEDHPNATGKVLAGALLWQRGDWAGARGEWGPILDREDGWRAELAGVNLHQPLALAALAGGDLPAAAQALERAVRADSASALPRLMLAWLAKRAGNTREAEFQLAAAASWEVQPPGLYGLSLEYTPALEAIQSRYPDCFPATYLLAVDPSRRGGMGSTAPSVVLGARRTLEELVEQFPNWSGPLQVLQRGAWDSEEGRGELLLRRRREITVLAGPQRTDPVAVPAGGAPGALLRAARLASDSSEDRVIAPENNGVILVGQNCQVFEGRTGALVHTFALPYGAAPAAVSGHTVIKPLPGGVAAFEALNGDLLWTRDWSPEVREAPRVQGPTVLLAAEDGTILALEAATGRTLWESGRPSSPHLNLAVEEERLFLVGRDGRTRALDLKTGKELWSVPFPGAAQGGALRVEKGQSFAFGGRLFVGASLPDGSSRNTVAFDVQTGKLLWSQGHPGGSRPLRVQIGDRLALVSPHRIEYELLDPATGTVIKTRPDAEKNPQDFTWKGVIEGKLVWLDRQGRWHAIDPVSGATAWSWTLPTLESWRLAPAPDAWLAVGSLRIQWHAR